MQWRLPIFKIAIELFIAQGVRQFFGAQL